MRIGIGNSPFSLGRINDSYITRLHGAASLLRSVRSGQVMPCKPVAHVKIGATRGARTNWSLLFLATRGKEIPLFSWRKISVLVEHSRFSEVAILAFDFFQKFAVREPPVHRASGNTKYLSDPTKRRFLSGCPNLGSNIYRVRPQSICASCVLVFRTCSAQSL